jgi:hypothetical protein
VLVPAGGRGRRVEPRPTAATGDRGRDLDVEVRERQDGIGAAAGLSLTNGAGDTLDVVGVQYVDLQPPQRKEGIPCGIARQEDDAFAAGQETPHGQRAGSRRVAFDEDELRH